MGRGEPISDTARCMERYCDGMMIRTYGQEIVEEFARFSSIPVINGLTDLFHPCQIMADLMTVMEQKQTWERLKFAWIGDGNNVAHSLMLAARLGLSFTCLRRRPTSPTPPSSGQGRRKRPRRDPASTTLGSGAGSRCPLHRRLGHHGAGAEAAPRRPFPRTGQRGADAAGRPDALFMHCLPAHRDEEVTEEVIESELRGLRSGRKSPPRAKGAHAGEAPRVSLNN